MLRFYNTLTKKKEEFRTINPGKVLMYTCGPTVYDYAHIGNFRTYIFEDLLRRYLEYKGYKVVQVMNLTDVDDKTIKNSIANRMKLSEYTQKYKRAFFEDLKTLNIEPAEFYPEATAYIPEMIELIKKLKEKGYSYQTEEGSIYYSISKFQEYGKLSGFKLDKLKPYASGRIKADEYEKENIADFVLWKSYDEQDGDVFWDTELGRGRPGWHIECSAMAMKYLGETFDIHTGGVDNIFPHHENEIAQSEAATGKRFANFWLHCEHLVVEGEKMAKSKSNFYTLRDLLAKNFSARAIRFLLLSTYYKKKLNFTFEGLEASKNACERLQLFYNNIQEIKCGEKYNNKIDSILDDAKKGFEESMDDDLNISEGLSFIFNMVRNINSIVEKEPINEKNKEMIINTIQSFDKVLGIIEYTKVELDAEIEKLISARNQARLEKRYSDADNIRKEIESRGIILEDTKSGTRWRWKKN